MPHFQIAYVTQFVDLSNINIVDIAFERIMNGALRKTATWQLEKKYRVRRRWHKLFTFYIISRIRIFCNTFMNEYDIWTYLRGIESEIVVYDFVGEIVGTKWKNCCTRLCEVIAGCISDERYFVILNKMFTISILTKEMRKAWSNFIVNWTPKCLIQTRKTPEFWFQ